MALTAAELNRATLARQLLLERAAVDVEEAVRRIVLVQAQEPASPYLALWARVVDLDLADVDRAFADARLVRSTLLRITLHVVHADDHATFHHAMQPTLRAARLRDRRLTETELSAQVVDDVLPAVRELLAEPRSNAEVASWLEARGLHDRAWWALRHYAPVRHAVTGGPWSFATRPRYVDTSTPTPDPADADAADAALQRLVVRYLEGFGPATRHDIAQVALVPQSRIVPALAALDDRLERLVGPDGVELLDVPDAVRPPGDVPAPPRLLPMWESTLLAYRDRTRLLPDDLRPLVIRRNGDLLPTLLVDGHVVGVWRATEEGIEATAFRELTPAAWAGLDQEAAALRATIADRDPLVHGRYRRWWDRLPEGERRVLGV